MHVAPQAGEQAASTAVDLDASLQQQQLQRYLSEQAERLTSGAGASPLGQSPMKLAGGEEEGRVRRMEGRRGLGLGEQT